MAGAGCTCGFGLAHAPRPKAAPAMAMIAVILTNFNFSPPFLRWLRGTYSGESLMAYNEKFTVIDRSDV